jgi:hypothetical protein
MEKEKGSWTYYGQSIPFNQERMARSVDLAVGIEFEIFEGKKEFNMFSFKDLEAGFAVGGGLIFEANWEFKGEDSYTIRSMDGPKCVDGVAPVPRNCYNFPERYWAEGHSPKQKADWDTTWNPSGFSPHMRVPGFKIREQWMP